MAVSEKAEKMVSNGFKAEHDGKQTDLKRVKTYGSGGSGSSPVMLMPIVLEKIARLIIAKNIYSSELITMKTLKNTGAIGNQIRDGGRLMGHGAEHI
uniref:Uncharacterized protein n=1 Tax=Lactuca sativa TaxID=4236 RepID=A0A9R1VDG8_LACSA|nr:hypothetical protein LSAT_V11C500238530 [Lactuca sativa]